MVTNHQERPYGVVEKDCGGYDEHCETSETVQLGDVSTPSRGDRV